MEIECKSNAEKKVKSDWTSEKAGNRNRKSSKVDTTPREDRWSRPAPIDLSWTQRMTNRKQAEIEPFFVQKVIFQVLN